MRSRWPDVVNWTYFFTVNLFDRSLRLSGGAHRFVARNDTKAKAMHPFEIDAMVISPGHLHAQWTLSIGVTSVTRRAGFDQSSFASRNRR